jgi:hypothetical protein
VLQLRAVGDTKILLVCVDGFYVIFPDMFFSFLEMKSSYGHENTLFAIVFLMARIRFLLLTVLHSRA